MCVCFFRLFVLPVFARVFVDVWALIQMNDVNTLLNTDYDPVLEARSAYVITNSMFVNKSPTRVFTGLVW